MSIVVKPIPGFPRPDFATNAPQSRWLFPLLPELVGCSIIRASHDPSLAVRALLCLRPRRSFRLRQGGLGLARHQGRQSRLSQRR